MGNSKENIHFYIRASRVNRKWSNFFLNFFFCTLGLILVRHFLKECSNAANCHVLVRTLLLVASWYSLLPLDTTTPPPPGGNSLLWPIGWHAAGQGKILALSWTGCIILRSSCHERGLNLTSLICYSRLRESRREIWLIQQNRRNWVCILAYVPIRDLKWRVSS